MRVPHREGVDAIMIVTCWPGSAMRVFASSPESAGTKRVSCCCAKEINAGNFVIVTCLPVSTVRVSASCHEGACTMRVLHHEGAVAIMIATRCTEEHWGPHEQHSAVLGRSAGQDDRAPGGLLVKMIAHPSGVCWSR